MTSATSQELVSDFRSHPLYNALLASPHVALQPTTSRNPPSPNPTNVHTFYSSTLFTPNGLRAIQSFHARKGFATPSASCPILPTSISQSNDGHSRRCARDKSADEVFDDALLGDWLVLISLGTGLNGPGGIIHGGLAMTLLDSAMAERAFRAAGEKPVVTKRYFADFRRKIKAPCVVLCRAWIDAGIRDEEKDMKERSKRGIIQNEKQENDSLLHTRGTIEDGMGVVYLEATAEFAVRKEGGKTKL